jgi:hypothetical protein
MIMSRTFKAKPEILANSSHNTKKKKKKKKKKVITLMLGIKNKV